jgi:hypothetical protein
MRAAPTLLLFKDGALHATQVGTVSKTPLAKLIDAALQMPLQQYPEFETSECKPTPASWNAAAFSIRRRFDRFLPHFCLNARAQ